MAERKRHAGLLNQRQLAFVVAHGGNDTEAARAAGYKNPQRSAPKLMAMPAIRRAIAEKQRAIIAAAGAKIGRRLSRVDVVERLIELADLPPERTRYNIGGQVSALKAIAELEGYVNRGLVDLTKDFADRTVEEKEFFATHGYYPNQVELSKPRTPGSESAGENGDQQTQNDSSSPVVAGGNSDPLRVGDQIHTDV